MSTAKRRRIEGAEKRGKIIGTSHLEQSSVVKGERKIRLPGQELVA